MISNQTLSGHNLTCPDKHKFSPDMFVLNFHKGFLYEQNLLTIFIYFSRPAIGACPYILASFGK